MDFAVESRGESSRIYDAGDINRMAQCTALRGQSKSHKSRNRIGFHWRIWSDTLPSNAGNDSCPRLTETWGSLYKR